MSFTLLVQTMMGETHYYKVDSQTLLMDLRLFIFLDLDIFPEDQILLFNNKELLGEEKMLGEFGLTKDKNKVMLMVRIQSGRIY